MTVICNATPLINFATINRLNILQELFGEVLIPNAVYFETTSNNFPNSLVVLQAVSSGWLKIQTVSSIRNDILDTLDPGEKEVIALAMEIGEGRVLLDEQEARKTAHNFGLQVIGTLGILLLAKNRKIVTKVQPLLDAMIHEAQYWVNQSLKSNNTICS